MFCNLDILYRVICYRGYLISTIRAISSGLEFTILTKLKLIAAAVLISLAGMPFTAAAQDYDKGLAAAHSGDYATALKEFKPLAEQGDANAQYDLGVMYAKGMGVPQDFSKALGFYILAAEQGNALAQYSLGVMYENGMGVPQDFSKALGFYILAAEQGNASAQNGLGQLRATGKGIPQDFSKAMIWLKLAAEQGYAGGQYEMGVMYGNGTSVPQDYVLAQMWYNIAAANGNDTGSENRDIVAAKMTSEDISKAQSMARECMASDYKNCGE
jgi:TPR repeat protein